MGPVILAAAGIAVAVFLFVLARRRELFLLSVRNGRVLLVRGTLRPSLLHAFADVAHRGGIERATIQGLKTEGHARLVVKGHVDVGTVQRLRNVFGIHPMRGYQTTRSDDAKRNLGQFLGVVWLAWLLERSTR